MKLIKLILILIISMILVSCDRDNYDIKNQLAYTVRTPNEIDYPEYRIFQCRMGINNTCDMDITEGDEEDVKYRMKGIYPSKAIALAFSAAVKDIHIIGNYKNTEKGIIYFVFEFGNDAIEEKFDEEYDPNKEGSYDQSLSLVLCESMDDYYCNIDSKLLDRHNYLVDNKSISISRDIIETITPLGLAAVNASVTPDKVDVKGIAFDHFGNKYIVYTIEK